MNTITKGLALAALIMTGNLLPARERISTAGEQQIDTVNSVVNFEIGNLNFRTVEGSFSGMKGRLSFDTENLEGSFFDVSIDPATVSTGNKKRDKHLRSEDFFEVENYPEIRFTSTSVIPKEDGYRVKGQLQIREVTREAGIDFTFNGEEFRGTLEVNRFDYKVGEGTGKFTAGELVSLEIICRLNPAKG